MPQIMVLVSPEAAEEVMKRTDLKTVGAVLIRIVESVFKIPSEKNDVGFDVKLLEYTINEADIQLEISYTVGKDEYVPGEIFDPSDEVKKALIERMKDFLQETFEERIKNASIFLLPHREGMFETFRI
jgi:hypothetical protein